uniref:Membrane-spanning 4-domains subfamily A member 15 n=1 Tax=Oreochromis niloticus TaxID=8128 RepID=I3IYT5_ORENI
MSASTSAAGTVGSVFVVTHVIPATEPQNTPQKTKFSQGRPEALGTVQIMVGLLVLLFGIIVLPHSDLEIYSGVFLWGPLSVRGALGANVIAAVSSAAAIIIYILEAFWPHYDYHYYGSSYLNTSTPDWSFTPNYERVQRAVFGVLAVLCLLEFIVSICIAAFSCYALCTSTDQPIIFLNKSLEAASEVPCTYESPPVSEAPPPSEVSYEDVKYDTKIV